MISSWERGEIDPSPHYRSQLCAIFKKSSEALELLPIQRGTDFEESEGSLDGQQAGVEVKDQSLERETPLQRPRSFPDVNIPIPHDASFTGREKILEDIHAHLVGDSRGISILALSGMAGVGKTYTATEYAYRYASEYQTIFWAAADTREMLVADLIRTTSILGLSQKHEYNPDIVVFTVKHWLQTHNGWLFILDNIEDVRVIQDFLPQQGSGHILLTTLAQQSLNSIAPGIEIEEMSTEEGAILLLRRTKKLKLDQGLDQAEDEVRVQAEAIVKEMAGLPLALDQAAAYIAETECSLVEYFERYQQRRIALLDLRGASLTGHPLSVVVTFSLLFEKVEQANLSAFELLRFCAFFHPVDIPPEILVKSAAFVDPSLQAVLLDPHLLDQAVNALRKYSLMRRHSVTRSLSMHRLVQIILKERLDEDIQRRCAEWAVRAVEKVFSQARVVVLQEHAKYFPHVLECAEWIHRWDLRFTASAHLLYLAAYNLQEHAIYEAAKPLTLLAWNTYKQVVGPDDPEIVHCLVLWASLYQMTGDYTLSEVFYRYAQMVCGRRPGRNNALRATIYHHLAHLYMKMGKFRLAKKYCIQALDLYRVINEENLLEIAIALHTLGMIYAYQGLFELAEDTLSTAAILKAHVLGDDHPEAMRSVTGLAMVYVAQEDVVRAEECIQRALTVSEALQWSEHPDRAQQYEVLAVIRERQHDDEQVEALLHKALSIFMQVAGKTQPDAVRIKKHLANFYRSRHREKEAQEYQQQWTQQASAIKFYNPVVAIDVLEKYLRELGMNTQELVALSAFVASLMEKEKHLR